jgi:group I intron endonuclease
MGYTNNKCGVYRIHFIGIDKSYIGLTKGFKGRRSQHLRMLIHNKHFNIHLQRAFNKYGKDNFIIELIEECDKKDLSEKEKYYIKMYNSFKNGYNLTTGGEDCNLSEDVKKRISEKHKGKIVKPETREKLRIINLGKKYSEESKKKHSDFFKQNPFTVEQKQIMSKAASYKRSDETIKKMSDAAKGKVLSIATKNKLIIHNLKKIRPNSIFEIVDEKVFVDGYQYIKGKRNPLEQEIFFKEKQKRKIEGIEKRRVALTGKKRTQEQKEKISKSLKGLKRTPEQILANSQRQKGIKKSEEFKQKLRDFNKRKKEKLWVVSQN